MFVRKNGTAYEVWTPAKLNLTLEVVARRSDGFHEIESLMTTISIYDTLRFSRRDSCHLEIQIVDQRRGTSDLVPSDDSNLALQALRHLHVINEKKCGGYLHLTKRIPVAAGLGGGSSDAAAALVAGNLAWQLGLGLEKLRELGAMLGSDVPFFLHPSPAICRGRGEQISAGPAIGRSHFVVAKPPVGLSTAEVYGSCQPAAPDGSRGPSAWGRRAGTHVMDGQEVSRLLTNKLQPAAERLSPWIGRMQEAFRRVNVAAHQMSGSGTAYFGICRNAKHAGQTAHRLRSMGIEQVAVATNCRGFVLST